MCFNCAREVEVRVVAWMMARSYGFLKAASYKYLSRVVNHKFLSFIESFITKIDLNKSA